MAEKLSQCAQMVRRYDKDRFWCTLFAPADKREDLFALYAFSQEIAQIPEKVSEPLLGQIRLQWWREQMDDIYAGRPPQHEVAVPFSIAIRRRNLSRKHIDRLLDAREYDFMGEAPQDLDHLEDYAAGTSSAVFQLALEILDERHEEAGRAAHHAGIAWALSGLMRSVPFHRVQGRVYLPEETLKAHGSNVGEVLARRNAKAVREAVSEIAARAEKHAYAAGAVPGCRRSTARYALLPNVLAKRDLKRLKSLKFNVDDPRLRDMPLARQMRVAWAAVRRQV